MTTSAPRVRAVDMLTGTKAPTKFFRALSEADHFCRELDEVNELRVRVQELEEAERLAKADADDAAETIGLLIAERDRLARELAELRARLIRDEWKGRGW